MEDVLINEIFISDSIDIPLTFPIGNFVLRKKNIL